MADIKPAEVSAILRKELAGYESETALEEAEQEMGLQEAYVKKNYDNITVHTLCKTGLLLDSIVGICNNMTINLIVLGTTGVSNIFENFLGSNASALVGNVKVPMITIPNEGVVNFPKHIVAANDLMGSGEEKVFVTAASTGAEDFSFFAQKVPSMFYVVGGKPLDVAKEDSAPHHTPDFYIEESGMITGIKGLSLLTLDYMSQH